MYLHTTFLLTLILGLTTRYPITDTAFTQALRQSFCRGDARQLSTRFASSLQLIIDADGVYRTSVKAGEAEQLLRTFFQRHPPRGFQFTYQGASDRLHYSTGTYATSRQSFAVYVLMRQADDLQYTINTLHVKRE